MMRPILRGRRLGRGSLFFILLTGAAVCPSAAAVAADAAADGQVKVAEVIVTAQKKAENLQAVPASVTALKAETLSRGGMVDFQDYAAMVPGLALVSPREGSTQLTLRGITTGVTQSATATAVYIDEAPIGSVNAYAGGAFLTPDLDPADLSQIEVLKGPQGTLYGTGAMGGLVKFVTSSPEYTRFGGRLSAGFDAIDGHGDGYSARGLLNVPVISDRLALRVSGFYRYDPGYISNVTGQKDDNGTRLDGGRVDLAWRPDEHLSVDIWALRQDTRDNDIPQETVNGVTLQPVYGDLKTQAYISQPASTWMRIFNDTVKGQWDGFDVTSSTTYETIKSDSVGDGTQGFGELLGETFGIPDFGVKTTLVYHTDRFAQELRLHSALLSGKLDYQLGLFFTQEQDYVQIPGYFPFDTATLQPIAFPQLVSAVIDSRYTEYSGFANATYHLTDRLSLLAGVRYSSDDQVYRQDFKGLLIGPEIISKATSGDQVATWQVSPTFQIDDNDMVYFRAASGYRPGGPNAVPPAVIGAPLTFQPDRLVSYEAGYKAAFLDRRLTLDVAAFYIDWNKIQIQTNEAGFNFFVNGGAAHSKGGEVSISAVPAAGLTLDANAAYTDARLASPAAAAGGVTGDELPFVPSWTFSFGAQYRREIHGDYVGVVGGSVNYVGDRVSDFSQRAAATVPDFATVNLNMGVEWGRYAVSLYAKNLNDSRGITYLKTLGLSPAAEPFTAAITQPRSFGMMLSARL